jgi:transcriptional regulator with GAF, ATPase, and Fis domain
MRELMATVRRVADSRATVLIRGESGTGKELIAKALHRHSARAHRAFVAVSCAALPETLLESELFGYEKGAFTGAAGQKPGRFELANDGTLFLDEVGDIPPSLQVKLLRVIQEREFERIGGTRSIQVNVRLIAATNRNLEKLVAEGKFRDDLYFRLQVIQLVVPTLRERRDDIEPLALHFMKRYNLENGRKLAAIAPEALDLLKRYRFPGNVRELENAIERASVMADRDATVLTPDLLPITIQRYADAYDPD